MGRYQLGDDIWTIDRDELRLTITEPGGTQTIEDLATRAQVTTRFTILTNQKLRAGWKLLPAEIPDTPPPPIVTHDARHPDFEAAIFADPYSREARIIYGDWLQQQGDPRGHHIALCAAGATTERERFEKLNDRYLTGGVDGCVVDWGFLSIIRAGNAAELERRLRVGAARFATVALVAPSEGDLAGVISVLAREAPTTLRDLRLDSADPDQSFKRLSHVLARLTSLTLDVQLGELANMPPLSAIEKLALGPNTGAWVPRLLAREMPALRALSLGTELDADLVDALIAAPFARRLKTLALAYDDELIAGSVLLGKLPDVEVWVNPSSDYAAYEALLAKYKGRVGNVLQMRW